MQKKNRAIKIKPVPKMSSLKGVDRGAWKDTSKEIEKIRRKWDKEFKCSNTPG